MENKKTVIYEPKTGLGADAINIAHLIDLLQAEKEGRIIVLNRNPSENKDAAVGADALKHVMFIESYSNNAINRYISDAVAEKLVRDEEKASEPGIEVVGYDEVD